MSNGVVVKKTVYLSNKELLRAVIESKQQGKMTDELAKMLMLLCAKYATKGNFSGYTYVLDMQAYALLMLVKTWNSFNLEKSNNPFAFFTQCIKNSFIQFLNQEKRQRNVRDLLLVNQGLNPSFGYQQEESSDQHYVEDEQDFYHHKETAMDLLKQISVVEHIFNEDIVENVPDIDIDIDEKELIK
jgi:DNA-directed RNA polymerase specialized sigma subunit